MGYVAAISCNNRDINRDSDTLGGGGPRRAGIWKMSYSVETGLHLTRLLYETTINPGGWSAFIQTVAQTIAADSAFLRLGAHNPGEAEFIASFGYDPLYMHAYRDHYCQLDHYRPYFFTLPLGHVYRGEDVIAHADRIKTEFYNDYERPQDKHYVAGGCIARANGRELVFAIQRSRRGSAFTSADMNFVALLFPHVEQAFRIRRCLLTLETEQRAARDIFDRLPMAVFFVDADARPVFTNAGAEALLMQGDAIRLEKNSLVARPLPATTRFRRLITEASGSDVTNGIASGGVMRLRSGNTDLQVLVTPVSSVPLPAAFNTSKATAVVFITCTDRDVSLSVETLIQLYGFTQAEAKLAAGLAGGATLEALADKFGISKQTARVQLKSVFHKTDTHRQGELIARLLATLSLTEALGCSGSREER